MDTSETGTAAEKYHRCLVPVPPKALRYPQCGEPVHRSYNVRKFLTVFGLLMFLAITAVAYRMMQLGGAPSAAATDE